MVAMFDAVSQNAMVERTLPLGLLAAAGFLSSAGARVVDPLLAAIAIDFRTSVPAVSIVIAAFTLPYGLCQLVLGPVGDRFGKLRLMIGALLGYAVFTGACGFARDLTALTILRACAGGASAGLIPVCLAYIGDSVPYGIRQVTLSRFLVGVMLAQTVSGPLGGVFAEYVGWRGVFLLLTGMALVLAAALAQRLPSLPDRVGESAFNPRNYVSLATEPTARLLLIATLAEGALVAAVLPFVAPFLHEVYGLSFGTAGLILACFGIGALVYGRIAPWLVKRLGESGMVLVGTAILAGALALGSVSGHWAVFVAIELALGLGYFMMHTVLQARATELLPQARSTAVASFVFMLFVGQSLGTLASGLAIGAVGYRVTFAATAACILLLGLWLKGFIRRSA
jgi:predicted MFS family arabinose efflux permease